VELSVAGLGRPAVIAHRVLLGYAWSPGSRIAIRVRSPRRGSRAGMERRGSDRAASPASC